MTNLVGEWRELVLWQSAPPLWFSSGIMTERFGLEPVAIITILSLPWALLMWAMVMFFIALFFSFHHSNSSTRIFVAVALTMLTALIGWCVQWSSGGWQGAVVQQPTTVPHACVKPRSR
ncbi:hypothetical protein EDB85DRAFT_1932858 [Lactarius pseudohatsudake]|nr:hypothetical protein EDB85DRAFT_1932858 [Lactarius pseudohatsudake]